jgi:hypothetical protein
LDILGFFSEKKFRKIVVINSNKDEIGKGVNKIDTSFIALNCDNGSLDPPF